MTNKTTGVIAGFDCHLDTHVGVTLDPLGRVLDRRRFPASSSGYCAAHSWIGEQGPVLKVGIEGTNSFGAGLTRYFTNAGIDVIEVNQPHAHTRSRRGKNDFIDAEAAARKVLSGEATASAKDSTGIVESIRQLSVARNGAIKARSAALLQLGNLISTAPAHLREQLTTPSGLPAKARLCRKLRCPANATTADPVVAAKQSLRSIARRISALDDEIKTLDHQLESLVKLAAPRMVSRLGIGTHHAATLLTAAGQNIERLTSERAFARLCGVAPMPASSGKTQRHRLNPGGNRQANRTLHLIVVVRLRYCDQTRDYMQRRLTEGKTKKEIIRCLKRHIVRGIYRDLRADLATLQTRT